MQNKEQALNSAWAIQRYKHFKAVDRCVEVCRGTTSTAEEFFYRGDSPFWSDECAGWVVTKLDVEPVCSACRHRRAELAAIAKVLAAEAGAPKRAYKKNRAKPKKKEKPKK